MSGHEIERRKDEKKIAAHVVEVLIGKQSRKVALGVWLLIIATSLLKAALIASHEWMRCVYLVCGLIGFGTIMDEVLAKMGDQIASFAANKFNTIVDVKTETKVEIPSVAPTPAS
jgi:hypothetical protein